MSFLKIMDTCIYHLRYKEDHNNIDKGYIGLTNNPSRRKAEHWGALALNSHKNYKLQKAFNDRSEDMELVIYKEFDCRNDAKLLEETLRPVKNVGWNIAVGGERSEKERFRQKVFNVENEFIDEDKFKEKFQFIDSNFTLFQRISRSLFKPIINNWNVSKQSVILNNLFTIYYLDEYKASSKLFMLEAWEYKKSIFQGDWGAIPHDMTAAALAISVQIRKETLNTALKTSYLGALGQIIDEILVNGYLYSFNRVDAVLIDIVLYEYFIGLNEIDTNLNNLLN